MSRRRNTILPIALLGLAAIAIAAIVYGLLWREARRIQQIADDAALQQARAIAENVGLIVAEAKTALVDSLNSFRGPNFDPQLETWQSQEPLAQLAFVWDPARPDALSIYPANSPRRDILAALQAAWQLPRGPAAIAEPQPAQTSQSAYVENVVTRQQIRAESNKRSTTIAQKSANTPFQAWTTQTSHWTLATLAGQPTWLGFVSWNDGKLVTGAALQQDALLGAFANALPMPKTSAGPSFALLRPDGSDALAETKAYPSKTLFDRASLSSLASKAPPEPSRSIDLAPELPGWRLAVASDPLDTMATALFSPGGLATGALLALLLACGLWLAWQSRASQLEAAQKVTFVSNVSHELKTPLTTIRMYSELLQSDRLADPAKRASYLDTIASESQRLARMVNNVLDFSRLEKGKGAATPRPQHLSNFLRPYLEQRRTEIEARGFTFLAHVEESAHDTLFDADALAQILGNLIDNSLKYAREAAHLSIRSHEEANAAYIEVADRGPGLPPRLRRKTFKPFERGDTSLVAECSGFGLGLSIAQSLAAEMGATLAYYHPRAPSESPSFVLTLQTPK